MSAMTLAQNAYAQAGPALKTDRAIEAQVLSGITARMGNQALTFPEQVRAVHDNRRFWTLLAADVSTNDNSLPSELRAQIFYLAEYSIDHSDRFLKGDADLTALVDINTAIIRGLTNGGGR